MSPHKTCAIVLMRHKNEARQLLKDKKFWFASILIAWAAGLLGHMMWLQRQDTFKQKFGKLDENNSDGDIQE